MTNINYKPDIIRWWSTVYTICYVDRRRFLPQVSPSRPPTCSTPRGSPLLCWKLSKSSVNMQISHLGRTTNGGLNYSLTRQYKWMSQIVQPPHSLFLWQMDTKCRGWTAEAEPGTVLLGEGVGRRNGDTKTGRRYVKIKRPPGRERLFAFTLNWCRLKARQEMWAHLPFMTWQWSQRGARRRQTHSRQLVHTVVHLTQAVPRWVSHNTSRRRWKRHTWQVLGHSLFFSSWPLAPRGWTR